MREVFVNGEPYAGTLRVDITTQPKIPLEDFIFGRYDPTVVKLTQRFFLDPDEGAPIELLSGTVDIRNNAGRIVTDSDDLADFPEFIQTVRITTPSYPPRKVNP